MTIALDTQHHVRRFLTKTRWGGPDGTCLEWVACISKWGYGKFGTRGRVLGAHRIAWEMECRRKAMRRHYLRKIGVTDGL